MASSTAKLHQAARDGDAECVPARQALQHACVAGAQSRGASCRRCEGPHSRVLRLRSLALLLTRPLRFLRSGVAALLILGADANARDGSYGSTALHWAAQARQPSYLQIGAALPFTARSAPLCVLAPAHATRGAAGRGGRRPGCAAVSAWR